MNAQDAFERSLKKTLEPYEVPYNSADWAQLEGRMDLPNKVAQRGSLGLYALLFAGAVAVGTTAYLLASDPLERDPRSSSNEITVPEQLDQVIVEDDKTALDQQVDQVKDLTVVVGSETMIDASMARARSGEQGTPNPETPPVTSPTLNEDRSSAASIRASISEGCPGTAVTFAVENMPEEGIYLWNFGDGSFSNQSRPSHVFSKAGTFEVMLSHSSIGGSTVQNKPAADRIVIHEIPEASFKFLKQEYDNTVPSVHFENRSHGAVSYHWDFGDGHTSTIAHPDHIFKAAGDHTVVLTVTNTKGCTDRSERTIHIEDGYNLLAIKTFSPNGDGVDDLFIPDALKSLGVRFKLSIHDPRTGLLVYETSDPQRPWNGRIGNKGELCSAGEYVWMVEMKDGEKLGGTYNGTLGLLR
ncbi:MAG: PKD domain-containing protein [Flavobacteriales bacterium]|nr:PKD domain-containing protein [Flavobacteriales bacterium]